MTKKEISQIKESNFDLWVKLDQLERLIFRLRDEEEDVDDIARDMISLVGEAQRANREISKAVLEPEEIEIIDDRFYDCAWNYI